MKLDSEIVAEGLAILGSAFRRRISAEMVTVYARILEPRLDAQQFRRAVTEAVEQETEFPLVSVLLRRGEAVSRFEGVPYVGDTPLSEYLERAREGR